jgi:hypothetical protein
MSIKETILNVLGANPKNSFNEVEVKFYKDCNRDGQHGMVIVSHRVKRLDHVAVPFLFPGLTEPPALTARVLADIESAGASQGYVVHCLLPETYGPNLAEGDDLSADHDSSNRRQMFSDRLANPVRVPAVQREQGMMFAGVLPSDVDTFLKHYFAADVKRQAVQLALNGKQAADLRERLGERVAQAFTRSEKVGVIYIVLDRMLNQFCKEINLMVLSPNVDERPSGLPLPLSKLKEGSTLEQIQSASDLVDMLFPHEEYDTLTQIQKDEIQSRVLMSVNNDTARKLPSSVVQANVEQIITTFREINVVSKS